MASTGRRERRAGRFGGFLAASVLLAACAAPAPPDVARLAPSTLELPPMQLPAGGAAEPTRRSNRSIARDFMQLAFELENGRNLPVFTRFEGPITLRVTGSRIHPASVRDLESLLGRLRNEAGIDITLVGGGTPANITIEFLPRAILHRAAPNAACFISPGVSSWQESLRRENPEGRNWTQLTTRTRMAIFVPADVAPQEIRDCLHEELAQALGPVNDLYRLADSVFNDDNLQSVLTGFDMLILRVFYAPELSSGMPAEAVAQRLPAILARLNPAGRHPPARPWPRRSPQLWIRAIRTAHGARPGSDRGSRRQAALKAIRLARAEGLLDNRLALSLYAYGRLDLARNPQAALAALNEALVLYNRLPEARIHAAHVLWQQAVRALSAGEDARAAMLSERALPAALEKRNAALAATLLMIRAEALERLGRVSEAHQIRLDSLGWARYGFGSERKIRQQLRNIRTLAAGRYRQGKS